MLAVDDGTIAKLFLSKPGGITIYQFDPTSTYAYYYAHLSRYADGLKERAAVARGQVIGYVGTTGNAPPETPHLHFAIFQLTDAETLVGGDAIDPYPHPAMKGAGPGPDSAGRDRPAPRQDVGLADQDQVVRALLLCRRRAARSRRSARTRS